MSSSFKEELFKELNALRTNPKEFAERVLKPLLQHYDGNHYKVPGEPIVKTVEGSKAVEEAIQFCQNVESVGKIDEISNGLSRSAQDLVDSNGAAGIVDNVLQDGTTVGQRLVRYGRWGGKASEAIAFGKNSPSEAIAHWVVDDGNPTRSHRAALLEQRYHVIGIGHGAHASFDEMTVIVFAETYQEGKDASDMKYNTRTTNSSSPRDAPTTQQKSVSRNPSTTASTSSAAARGHPNNNAAATTSTTTTENSRLQKQSESVLDSKGDQFVLESPDLGQDITLERLELELQNKSLQLIITTETNDEIRRRKLVWQLPFSPKPEDVHAHLEAQKVQVLIQKPNVNLNGGDLDNVVAITSFTLPGSGSDNRMNVKVTQTEQAFICVPVPSKYEEEISVQHFKGNQIKFVCKHKEEELDENGSKIVKGITLSRVIQLPYNVPSSAISKNASNHIIVQKSATGSSSQQDQNQLDDQNVYPIKIHQSSS